MCGWIVFSQMAGICRIVFSQMAGVCMGELCSAKWLVLLMSMECLCVRCCGPEGGG